MEFDVANGRLADAERLIRDAMNDPRIDGTGLPLYLGPIYILQGRVEEALRSVEARWAHLNEQGEGATEKAINLVRLHIELRRRSLPREAVESFLSGAGASAPEDDRVWLGKANLAIRTGALDEARRWLDACLGRGPEDVPVWRARLKWAMAANKVPEARDAAKHLPLAEVTPAQIPTLAAWLARRLGDRAAERRALERLIEAVPMDLSALDRLAAMAVEEGQPDRAAELRRRKTEIEELQSRYERLYQRNQPFRDSGEMTALAERLGQRFEARAFGIVAVASNPDRDDLRRHLAGLNQQMPAVEAQWRTLADALAAEFEAVTHAPAPDRAPSTSSGASSGPATARPIARLDRPATDRGHTLGPI
jgi:tetratricopeptide (TPR) repeat protein